MGFRPRIHFLASAVKRLDSVGRQKIRGLLRAKRSDVLDVHKSVVYQRPLTEDCSTDSLEYSIGPLGRDALFDAVSVCPSLGGALEYSCRSRTDGFGLYDDKSALAAVAFVATNDNETCAADRDSAAGNDNIELERVYCVPSIDKSRTVPALFDLLGTHLRQSGFRKLILRIPIADTEMQDLTRTAGFEGAGQAMKLNSPLFGSMVKSDRVLYG